jgi:hypothetical protein
MKVKMTLPALTEALSPYFRPIKSSLFPLLRLNTLAGYLSDSDVLILQDQHVESLMGSDHPDLTCLQHTSNAGECAFGPRAPCLLHPRWPTADMVRQPHRWQPLVVTALDR